MDYQQYLLFVFVWEFMITLLAGLTLCCFQMLFFPSTQEKEDNTLTKHPYYSQLFSRKFY